MSSSQSNDPKSALRAAILAGRKIGHDCSHAHSQLLIDLAWEKKAKTIACFVSFGDEPNTNVFLKHCQMDEKVTLYVPRVSGDDLEWVPFGEDQIRHPLGMNEPVGKAVELNFVDLLVVPALAIDKQGQRLGRGKGYYDRALEKLQAAVTVGVVHDNEFIEDVPVEGHDKEVDLVCTCSALISTVE